MYTSITSRFAKLTALWSDPAYGDAASLSNDARRDPDSDTPSRLYIFSPGRCFTLGNLARPTFSTRDWDGRTPPHANAVDYEWKPPKKWFIVNQQNQSHTAHQSWAERQALLWLGLQKRWMT